MKIPPWVYRGRDVIEALVPRDSSISAVVHVGAGAGIASAVVFGGSKLMDKPDPHRPDEVATYNWRNSAASSAALATLPLVLTAGMQLALPTERVLNHGISPMYFLAAGALFGLGFYIVPVNDALKN